MRSITIMECTLVRWHTVARRSKSRSWYSVTDWDCASSWRLWTGGFPYSGDGPSCVCWNLLFSGCYEREMQQHLSVFGFRLHSFKKYDGTPKSGSDQTIIDHAESILDYWTKRRAETGALNTSLARLPVTVLLRRCKKNTCFMGSSVHGCHGWRTLQFKDPALC